MLAAATKELQLRILDLVKAKDIVQRLNDVQDTAPRRAVIRVYDAASNVIETHEHAGDFKAWWSLANAISSFEFMKTGLAIRSPGGRSFDLPVRRNFFV